MIDKSHIKIEKRKAKNKVIKDKTNEIKKDNSKPKSTVDGGKYDGYTNQRYEDGVWIGGGSPGLGDLPYCR